MEEKKLLTVEFFDKRCTTVAVPHLCEDLLKIDGDILECNEKIEAAGLAGVSYTSKSSQICEGCDQLGNMNAYVDSAHAQVSDGLDWPLWLNFKSGATETISRIKVEDISTENTIGLEEHVEITGHGVRVYNKQVKSKLTFEDFVELDPVKGTVVRELTEVGGMKTFRSLFHLEYVKVKEQMPDVNSPREYMKELLVWGQQDHKGYHPVKDFFSGLADLIFIVPLIEMCIGYDFIADEDLTDQEIAMKGVAVATDLISLGLALKMVKGVNLLSKTGLQVGAKAVALDLTSSAVGYTVGDLSNRLGLPLPITLILSGGATAGTFKVASKHVFSDADSIVKVLNGGRKAEGNLKFSLEGSSKSTSKIGGTSTTRQNLTREDIINALDGVTPKSTQIANEIKSGNVKVNILGDELFESYLGCSSETMAVQVGDQIYMRRSSSSLFSDVVHEGTHAVDYINKFGQEGISLWEWEKRAYFSEFDFQIGSGVTTQFSNEEEIMVHIWGNYSNNIHNPY